MQRRTFLKNTFINSAGVVVIPYLNRALGAVQVTGSYESFFIDPPDNARPWCFYMWMNGNVTKEGITLDLEAMKRMGIGGYINFNTAVGIPRGKVDYAGGAWADAVVHEAAESQRLGITMFLHNSPGYSGCGGPWIKPEFSMQELVWTEALIIADSTKPPIKLDKPYAKQNYYRDAFVIAYPSLQVEKALMKDKLVHALVDGNTIDKNIIVDGSPETKIRLPLANSTLLMEFAEPFEARAISILRKPEIPRDLFDGPRDHPPVLLLEASTDGEHFKAVGRISCVELRQMDTPSTLSFEVVIAKFYRLTATSPTWLSEVQLHSGPRLGGWSGKTSHTHGSSGGETPGITPDLVIQPKNVIDISTYMDADGNLNWDAPSGRWTIVRIGHTTTGEIPAAHPDAAGGLEIDMYNSKALDQHFKHFLDPLFTRLKPYMGKSFKGLTVDSWEAGKQNWTVNFRAEFRNARNYDLMQWMPAMTGRIVGTVDDTERFLWDVRKTHADLIAINFYGYMQECCHKRGLQFNAEPYGDAVFDSLQVGKYLDTPMSEFWSRYIYGSDDTSKQAASLAHVYGRKVAAAEAFTGMPANSKWKDYPFSLKAEGDYFFALGINRLVFHTFVHQPYKTGSPGMTMGPFGTHFDRNNTWTEQAYGWTNYLKRAQYLLQQGLFVADACYFKGDEPASGIPDTYRLMPDGYVSDVIGADGLNRLSIKNELITLPDGMRYRLCILGRINAILPKSLTKLKQLVADGMTLVVSGKPNKTFGRGANGQVIKEAVDELYGDLDGLNVKTRNYGKGKLIWTTDYKQLFSDLAVQPDFTFTAQNPDAAILYTHKQLNEGELYFISNHRRTYEKIQCSFRVTGLQPELWNAETGKIHDLAVFEFTGDRTIVALELEPAEAVFVVFRKKVTGGGVTSILKDGKPYLSVLPYPAVIAPYADVRQNFTVSVWAKPDSFAQDGRSMIFHAPQGERLYGAGHAAMAVGAGQNGVRVYENTAGRLVKVISDEHPIEGWTHIVVIYQNGKPDLYLNGKLSASGTASGKIVHPGMGAPPSRDQYTTYFEGNNTRPQLFRSAWSDQQVVELYNKGLLLPEMPISVKLKQLATGHTDAEFFENGSYLISGTKGNKQLKVSQCEMGTPIGDWKVLIGDLKTDYGDLKRLTGDNRIIRLPELISLRKQPDFDVKHFSGTATYHNTLHVPSSYIRPNKNIYLDLGRVEVIAEVKINGRKAGNVWREPYRLNITGWVKAGNNVLEIAITTLWPNRLIGDEYLPVENEYSPHGFVEKLPDWYINNQPKPGKRKAFTTWKNFDKNSPMVESGLLGPVKLMASAKYVIS